MTAVTSVELPLTDSEGRERGALRIRLLPDASARPAALLDQRSNPTRDGLLEPVQLLEDREYRYELRLMSQQRSVQGDPAELLVRDSDDGLSGSLRPGSHTGRLVLRFSADGVPLGQAPVEVRSRKLGYLDDYRWMLRDIAGVMSEVVMERFGPTEQRFAPDHARDAATLYQRFAFLQNLLIGETFDAAIAQVLGRPHRGWVSIDERRPSGRGIPGSSGAARQLARAGPRVRWSAGPLAFVPAELDVEKQDETLDTPPNRFAKFALERWRDVVAGMVDALRREHESVAPVERGLRDATALLGTLDALLSQPLFREVGALTHFPEGDQVIQKREGYRELFRAYVEFEVASKLAWDGGDDVYGAGQRDVATLYEYWAFFQLIRVVAQICETPLDLASLVTVRSDGLTVNLKRGQDKILIGEVNRRGRTLSVELWFNRIFRGTGKAAGTWSREMRPDYSLRICPTGPAASQDAPDDVWLHFDAKYRVQGLTEIIGSEDAVIAEDDLDAGARDDSAGLLGVTRGQAKGSDLVKMHAYRDAIRRSAGAYVLYPGSEQKDFREYHEILPGLGAFALRPTASGLAEGHGPLTAFMEDVMSHVCSQLTQHERSRYWEALSFGSEERMQGLHRAVKFLPRPPADTLVLLGYVRGENHRDWIHRRRLYNLRGDGRRGSIGLGSRELAADLILLYGDELDDPELWRVSGEPLVMTREQMLEAGYEKPRGNGYYCLPISPVDEGDWAEGGLADRLVGARDRLARGKPHGAPVTSSWLELIIALDQTS